MQTSSGHKERLRNYYFAILLIWLIYAGLTFMAPQAVQVNGRYGLSTQQMNLLRLTVVLPFLFIWLTAIFAILRFKNYAKLVAASEEAQGFKNITTGLWFLFAAIIIPQLLGLVSSFHPNSFEAQKFVVITRNYLNILLYFGAFWYIFKSSKNLATSGAASMAKFQPTRTLLIAVVLVLSVFYCISVFLNAYRGVSSDPLIKPTYYLPDAMIVTTIIVPYILIWVLGTVAAFNIYTFSRNVSGIVYRKAFSSVAFGLGSIITLSILLQFLSQSGAYFGRAGLGSILGLVYFLLIAIAVGYLFIAKGARELTAIEEID